MGGGPPASRPRRVLRSARRLEARPGPAAAHRHCGQAPQAPRRPPIGLGLSLLVASALIAHRLAISHVIPLRLLQTMNWRRCNCNVCGWSPKVTVGNYVRVLPGLPLSLLVGPAAWPRGLPRRHGNFACNSLLGISNFEFVSLELQRFWALLKVHAIELHAKFGERHVAGLRWGVGWLRWGVGWLRWGVGA